MSQKVHPKFFSFCYLSFQACSRVHQGAWGCIMLGLWSMNILSCLKLQHELTITSSLSSNTSKHHAIFYHLQHVCVFLLFNNSMGNKWFNFKFSFQSIYITILCLTCFLTRYLQFIMFKFYHVLALGQMFCLQVNQYSHHFNYLPKFSPQHFGHSLDYNIFQLQVSFNACAHPINPMGIHFLCCVHGNEHTRTHDVVCDIFVTIM